MFQSVPLSLSVGTIALLDQLSAGIVVLDADLRFVHVNPAFIEMTGLARWRGCPLETLGPAAADVIALIARQRSAESTLVQRDFELRARGLSQRADVTVSAWHGAGVMLEWHLQPARADATAPKLSQSLRGLAHEVKNPLAGLRGAAQLLKRRVADADLQQLADLIIGEADRLAALTDRLLHPGGKPHLSVVNLHAVAERARALIDAEGAAEIQLERDYDPSLPGLRGDADRLLQLLLNLLRNAMQASAKNILVRTRADHGATIGALPVRLALRLDVIDDGVGVPDSLRESLFLPLVSGTAQGTGLGLALAQEIAHEHGGELHWRSRPGHTVFSLMLPLEAAHG